MTEERKEIKWHEVNCLGLKCPLPVMRLERALKEGHTHILIITDDPVSVVDIPLSALQNGAKLTNREENAAEFRFFVENVTK